jgi:hypothetical protein
LLLCACSREFDPEIRDEGVAKASDALEVCQDNTPDGVREPLLLATPSTAGEITDEARANLGRPIPPWDSLPPGHFVAKCNFGNDPDGEVRTYLVDEAGRSSVDEAPQATRL